MAKDGSCEEEIQILKKMKLILPREVLLWRKLNKS
jgi:hypothetical protein